MAVFYTIEENFPEFIVADQEIMVQ